MPKQKKRLRAKITVGHDEDGAIIKWASGYTKKELEANKEELRRTYINGAVAIRRDILFGEFVVTWYDTYKLGAAAQGGRRISESTKANYRTAINVHILPVFALRQMRAITAQDLQDFMNSKSGYSRTIIGDVYSVLKNVFALACAQGIIDRDPAAALKKPQAATPNERRALTEAETKAVLQLIKSHADALLLALLYYTGLRRGEALGLQWSDIDFTNKMISVKRDIDFETGDVGDLKTAASRREVPIPDELLAMLQKRREIGNGYLIRAPRTKQFWTKATYERHWTKLQEALYAVDPSIEHDAVGSILTPHYFRHNYATLLYEANVDMLTAQTWLGHSDPKTTQQIYTHLREKKQNKNATKIKKVFSQQK